jgi:signal recognition particle subunit SRP19
MVSRGEEKYVIWPIYFDKTCSRLHGRKVARKFAVEKPTCEAITKAAQSLHLHPVLEKNRAYPSRPFKSDGRVLVDKHDTKSKILLQIAKRLS